MAANSIVTPDPSGDIHQSRLDQADAELITACDRYNEHELQLLRLCYGPTKIPDSEWEAASDALRASLLGGNPAAADIRRLRATTLEGFRALARSALIEADGSLSSHLTDGGYDGHELCLAVLAVSLAGFEAVGIEIEEGRL